MAPAPNQGYVDARLELLKRIREQGSMKVGWGAGEITPPAANSLVAAGLLLAEQGVRVGEVVIPSGK